MIQDQIYTVVQRLNRLERENRWWGVVGIVPVDILCS